MEDKKGNIYTFGKLASFPIMTIMEDTMPPADVKVNLKLLSGLFTKMFEAYEESLKTKSHARPIKASTRKTSRV